MEQIFSFSFHFFFFCFLSDSIVPFGSNWNKFDLIENRKKNFNVPCFNVFERFRTELSQPRSSHHFIGIYSSNKMSPIIWNTFNNETNQNWMLLISLTSLSLIWNSKSGICKQYMLYMFCNYSNIFIRIWLILIKLIIFVEKFAFTNQGKKIVAIV